MCDDAKRNDFAKNESESHVSKNQHYREVSDDLPKLEKIYTNRKTKYNTFAKGLEHDSHGVMFDSTLKKIDTYQESKNWPSFYLDPLAADSLSRTGIYTKQLALVPYHSIKSKSQARDLIELYAMSLQRDSFSKKDFECIFSKAEISNPYRLFDYENKEYFSIFLPKVENYSQEDYFPTSKILPLAQHTILPEKITTPRQLAWLCRNGFPKLDLSVFGEVKIKTKYTPLIELTHIDIQNLISQAIHVSYLSAWYNKWDLHLKARPEYYGNLVNNNYCFDSLLMESEILNFVVKKQNNFLLSSTFPEGSPMSPSYPSSIAVVSGAVITILKYYFSNLEELNKLADNICMSRCWAGVNDRFDVTAGVFLGECIGLNLLKENIKRYSFKVPNKIIKFNKQCHYF